jgi:hypothetical protein
MAYKAADKVKVYADSSKAKELDQVSLVPYSMHGFAYYQYMGKTYKGYYCIDHQQAFICLDSPLFKAKA